MSEVLRVLTVRNVLRVRIVTASLDPRSFRNLANPENLEDLADISGC
jgi:hypothetical protein